MVRFKICGLMRETDAEYVSAVLPDYAGMIFAPNRRRTVSHETARAIRQRLDSRVPLTGVFVNAETAEIAQLVETLPDSETKREILRRLNKLED